MGFFKTKEGANLPLEHTDNVYLRAKEEWLERYGNYINRAAQWRMVAFVCLAITAISITGNVMQSMQVKTVPYIVEVDALGKTSVVSRADKMQAVPQKVIQAAIANCITDWRTVTPDVDLQQKMIERLSYYMAGSAKGVIQQWYEENNPYEVAKSGRLVHVEVKGLPLPVSADSYRVEWLETVRSHAGVMLESTLFEATVTIQLNPPTIDAVLLRNPGGVYITSLSTGKVLGAQAAPDTTAPINSQNQPAN